MGFIKVAIITLIALVVAGGLALEAGAAAIALDAIEPEANMQVMGRLLESLVTDGPARDRMAAALAAQPRVDAAEQIARRLAERARGR